MNKFSSKCLGFLSQKTCHWSSVELWVVFHFFVCKIEKNFHPVWNSNAGVWVGLIVNVIIPWGKNTISEEFGEVLLPFSSWGLSLRISGGYPEDAPIEHHQVMLPSSCTSPLQHKMLPHFRDPQVQHHLLRASCWGAGEGCGMVVGAWHLGELQALLSCSSPESTSPSHAWSCLAACLWCHVDHWKKAKNLYYGALKANHFLYREWILLEFFRLFLRILLDFIHIKFIRILLA